MFSKTLLINIFIPALAVAIPVGGGGTWLLQQQKQHIFSDETILTKSDEIKFSIPVKAAEATSLNKFSSPNKPEQKILKTNVVVSGHVSQSISYHLPMTVVSASDNSNAGGLLGLFSDAANSKNAVIPLDKQNLPSLNKPRTFTTTPIIITDHYAENKQIQNNTPDANKQKPSNPRGQIDPSKDKDANEKQDKPKTKVVESNDTTVEHTTLDNLTTFFTNLFSSSTDKTNQESKVKKTTEEAEEEILEALDNALKTVLAKKILGLFGITLEGIKAAKNKRITKMARTTSTKTLVIIDLKAYLQSQIDTIADSDDKESMKSFLSEIDQMSDSDLQDLINESNAPSSDEPQQSVEQKN